MRLWILLLTLWPLSVPAKVEVDLDTSTPRLDEPFRVSFSARGNHLSQPDLSVLQRDFRIVGRRVSRSTHRFNDRSEEFMGLDLTLTPTHAGTLEIPPLDFGGERSDAIRIRVTATRPVADDTQGSDAMPWPGNPNPFDMGGMPMQMPPPPDESTWPATSGPAPAPAASSPPPAPLRTRSTTIRYDPGPWPWMAALALTGWIATALTWWLRSRGWRPGRAQPPAPGEMDALIARIGRAATGGDPTETRAALMQWGRMRWPDSPPSNLRLLAARCPSLLQTHLLRLDTALGRAGGAGWSDPELSGLIQAFEKGES